MRDSRKQLKFFNALVLIIPVLLSGLLLSSCERWKPDTPPPPKTVSREQARHSFESGQLPLFSLGNNSAAIRSRCVENQR